MAREKNDPSFLFHPPFSPSTCLLHPPFSCLFAQNERLKMAKTANTAKAKRKNSKHTDYKTPNSEGNKKMKLAIADWNREKANDPNLTHRAFCNTYNLDDGFRKKMGDYMKDPQLLEGGCGTGKNQATELVKKSDTDAFNLKYTTQYTEEEAFAKVPVEGGTRRNYWPTLLGTLAKEEFGGRLPRKTRWKQWLSSKITKPCKAIYDKRAADANEESDDESDAGYDL